MVRIIRTQSPSTTAFAPGHSVYFVENASHAFVPHPSWRAMRAAPVELVPATIIAVEKQSRIQITCDDGRRRWVDGDDLAYRGFCGECFIPAVRNKKRELVCPSCRAEAIDAPMPDPMVPLWYPVRTSYGWRLPMIVNRAVRASHLTFAEHHHNSRWAVHARYRAMLRRFGLRQPQVAFEDEGRLQFHAMLDEGNQFFNLYQRLTLPASERLAA